MSQDQSLRLIEPTELLEQHFRIMQDAVNIEPFMPYDERIRHNISAAKLRSNRRFKKIVDRIGSNGDLLVSLLLQASSAQQDAQVDNLAALASDTIASLRFVFQMTGTP